MNGVKVTAEQHQCGVEPLQGGQDVGPEQFERVMMCQMSLFMVKYGGLPGSLAVLGKDYVSHPAERVDMLSALNQCEVIVLFYDIALSYYPNHFSGTEQSVYQCNCQSQQINRSQYFPPVDLYGLAGVNHGFGLVLLHRYLNHLREVL